MPIPFALWNAPGLKFFNDYLFPSSALQILFFSLSDSRCPLHFAATFMLTRYMRKNEK